MFSPAQNLFVRLIFPECSLCAVTVPDISCQLSELLEDCDGHLAKSDSFVRRSGFN